MKHQSLWYKILKYKYKKSINNNDVYSQKINNYEKLFLQNGGVLVDTDIDLNEKNDIEKAIKESLGKIATNTDLLGSGENGSVYLFTNNAVVKIISDKPSYDAEIANNNVVNKIANNCPLFPKFYYNEELELIRDCNKGIIVSEKLEPINILFKKVGDKYEINLDSGERGKIISQFVILFFILFKFYETTKNIIIHNDIKVDNLMLREVEDAKDSYNYIYNTTTNNNINIPYIKKDDKKYLLVLIDYGESYTYDAKKNIESIKDKDTFVREFNIKNTKNISNKKVIEDNIFKGINTYYTYLKTKLEYLKFGTQENDKKDICLYNLFNELTKIEPQIPKIQYLMEWTTTLPP